MRMMTGLAAAAALVAATAGAQEVRDCDGFEANAQNLVFPVEESTRSYANGAIRLIWLDTQGEPACCSSYLMVLLPSPEEPFDICSIVAGGDGRNGGTPGYTGFELDRAEASYDAATGLTVRMHAGVYDGYESNPVTLSVTVNQQTGEVRASQSPTLLYER